MLDQKRLNKFVLDNMLQPLALGSFTNWLRLLRANQGIEPRFLGRAIYVSLVSLATAPLRLYQRLRYRRTLENIKIRRQPVFILGHWRSGTTHLHNLLCQDPRLGYISALQVIAPELFYVAGEPFKSLLRAGTPETRLIDNMRWSIDGPEEEEMALANLSPYSLYHLWSFPQHAQEYFENYVLFKNVTAEVLDEWKGKYLEVLKMATLNMRGRRLVIKNPANTGRIPVLLEMFPKARFIHIHRDPYRVFVSTRNLYAKTLPHAQLQEVSQEQIENNILEFYSGLMQQYLHDRQSIPPQNLIEIGYDELDERPYTTLRRLYSGMRLRRFPRARLAMRRYLNSLGEYQKNTFRYDPADIEKVNRHWGFAFEAWGYPMQAL